MKIATQAIDVSFVHLAVVGLITSAIVMVNPLWGTPLLHTKELK
jgi:hypothetical protein